LWMSRHVKKKVKVVPSRRKKVLRHVKPLNERRLGERKISIGVKEENEALN